MAPPPSPILSETGAIFSGFSDNTTFTEVSITANYSLPSINVGEIRAVRITGPNPAKDIYTPSSGRYVLLQVLEESGTIGRFILTPSFGFWFDDLRFVVRPIKILAGGEFICSAGTLSGARYVYWIIYSRLS